MEIRLSQPDKDSIKKDYTDGADTPELMEMHLFYSPTGALQEARNVHEVWLCRRRSTCPVLQPLPPRRPSSNLQPTPGAKGL